MVVAHVLTAVSQTAIFADVFNGATIGQVTAFYTLNGTQGTISYTYVQTDNITKMPNPAITNLRGLMLR